MSYGRSSPDYDEDQLRGRNDFLYLRAYANGERHYGATVTDLTGRITLSWSADARPATGPGSTRCLRRRARSPHGTGAPESARRQPPGPQ